MANPDPAKDTSQYFLNDGKVALTGVVTIVSNGQG